VGARKAVGASHKKTPDPFSSPPFLLLVLTAVVNDVSKQAYAVIYRSRVNGETKVLYVQLE
jgi:multisubunit Na+/H+ antiporter MnhC subunit